MDIRTCSMLSSAVTALAVFLGACAGMTAGEPPHESFDRYSRYAGPPIDHFNYLGRLSGWTALDNQHVVIFLGINDAYLLTVEPYCHQLPFVQSLQLSATSSTVMRGFDYVKAGEDRCHIQEIRKVDYGQMKRDLRAEKHH